MMSSFRSNAKIPQNSLPELLDFVLLGKTILILVVIKQFGPSTEEVGQRDVFFSCTGLWFEATIDRVNNYQLLEEEHCDPKERVGDMPNFWACDWPNPRSIRSTSTWDRWLRMLIGFYPSRLARLVDFHQWSWTL